jgi:hypothetical protein
MSSSVSCPAVVHCLRTLSLVAVDLVRLVALAARPRAAWVAENLFLRKQLARFQERKVRPRRADASTRWMLCGPESMVRLARRAGECPSGHAPALAPPGIPPLLALEVEDDRPTAPAHPLPRVAPRDGGRQSHLGDRNASPTSCHCNWESGFPPHGREGSAPWRNGAHARLQAALAHQATAGMERAAWRPLQQATRPWSVTFRNERLSK